MNKFTALALTAAVGVAAIGYTKPAEARVYVGVGIGVYGPYYRGRPYLYRPGFGHYGYGFHGYGRRWR